MTIETHVTEFPNGSQECTKEMNFSKDEMKQMLKEFAEKYLKDKDYEDGWKVTSILTGEATIFLKWTEAQKKKVHKAQAKARKNKKK